MGEAGTDRAERPDRTLVRKWFSGLLGRSSRQNPLLGRCVGKRATTVDELATEARTYVRQRMYGTGGFSEAMRGARHTFLRAFGQSSSFTPRAAIVFLLRLLILCGAAFVPILGRRAMFSQPSNDDISGLAELLSSLTPLDFWLGLAGVVFLGLPKVIESWWNARRSRSHSSYAELAASIKKMPPFGNGVNVQDSLTDALNALRIEMAELVGDGRERLTDVSLLQYCDDTGTRMQVTARTAVGEPTHRPREAALFLANYVGREGRWFAEHDFLRSSNPFTPTRLTVAGNQRVDYRSVLYLPILTVVKPDPLPVGEHGPAPDVIDCCMGVICVHSRKPFRFWRWGDQKKENGGAFGSVAIERALPYIALITRLVESSAQKVRLETA